MQHSYEPTLVEDGRVVMSTALNAGREVSALITKTALEQYFWSRPDANEGHVLRIFADGRHRIAAVTRRLALRSGSTKVRLDEQDF
ncbi:DUF1488 family protein [Burkholderia sp. PAMC 26561]|uniref:DUF1488 family protein n=2 Tax=Burkholderia sp. PAMC 26561 TaxID=1795043 RepID=UPI003002BEA6